ncbi:MAG: hypothetical protein IPP13_16735 [Kouleothrix sp.]|jgi:hypothetical protein|nr:hypothetical protein [Kouleothrix sp.]
MTLYTFQLAGHLDQRWETVFEGFTISHQLTPDQQPITLLTGPVADQSALYGLMSRLRDLGVTLISAQPAAPVGTDNPVDR